MAEQSPVARAAQLGLRLAALASPLAPLLTRLVMGQAFFLTGRGKLEHFDNTVSFFTQLGIPLPEVNAAFISRLEYYGGILLILGLLTRLVAAGLASTMVVALLTADREHFLNAFFLRGDAGLTDITPFVYLLFLIWLVLSGPGLLSLDTFVSKAIGATPPKEPESR
jgi:putative oxidoreductase